MQTGREMKETQTESDCQNNPLLEHSTNENETQASGLDGNDPGEWITVKASHTARTKSSVRETNDQPVLAGENRFQALKIIPLETFEDEPFTPFGIDSQEKGQKALYKSKRGQKSNTAQQNLALKHAQEI